MRFPSAAYAPTTGQWNWLVNWHNDNHTASYGAVSTTLGIFTDYPVVSGAIGQNPHLVLRLAGGSSASPIYDSSSCSMPTNSFRYDHWYDALFHFVWHTNASNGLAEWWLDGQQVCSLHFPTLFNNPDGTQSYNTFGLYNYHLATPWSSEVDFDQVALGPDRGSVGG